MSARVRFGTAWVTNYPEEYVQLVREGEAGGFDLVGMGDSQSLFLDVYSLLTLAAANTERMMIGTTVTNPVTRHPATSAGAIASIQAISGGRAFFGLGGGDSSLLTIGERPASYRAVGEYGQAVRALTAGETVTWRDHEFASQLVDLTRAPLPRARRTERAASGRACRRRNIPQQRHFARGHRGLAAAHRAWRSRDGPPLSDIDVWLAIRGFFPTPSRETALDAIRFQLAGTINHVFRFSLNGKHVPDQLHQGVRALQREYRSDVHFNPVLGKTNAALLDKYGLTDWAAERFAVAGPPEYCVERLQELVGWGMTSFFISPELL